MDDVIAFLRARLDEDQEHAEAATWNMDASRWATHHRVEYDGVWAVVDSLEDRVTEVNAEASDSGAVARHIALHDPARVLREVEAKRRLLEQFRLRGDSVRRTVQPATGGVWDDLLRLLALPYADHDDYQEMWKP